MNPTPLYSLPFDLSNIRYCSTHHPIFAQDVVIPMGVKIMMMEVGYAIDAEIQAKMSDSQNQAIIAEKIW